MKPYHNVDPSMYWMEKNDDSVVHTEFKNVHLPLYVVLPGPGCKSKTVRVHTDTCKPAADLLKIHFLSCHSAFIVTDCWQEKQQRDIYRESERERVRGREGGKNECQYRWIFPLPSLWTWEAEPRPSWAAVLKSYSNVNGRWLGWRKAKIVIVKGNRSLKGLCYTAARGLFM